MNEIKASFMAAAGVVLAVGAIVGGALVRDRVDLGHKAPSVNRLAAGMGSIVASRDQQVPEGDYFYELTKLLKREYVEQVSDDQKLASGAVKGMVSSLGDPNSLYMAPDAFKAYKSSLKGEFEGIGADLVLEVPPATGKALLSRTPNDEDAPDPVVSDSSRIPKLVVAGIIPGGPADKAGVKPGDWVQSVDGRWVIDPDTVNQVQELQKRVSAPTPDATAITELRTLRHELRPKLEHDLMPLRAREQLIEGTSGTVKVVWHRGADLRATNIERGHSKLPDFTVNGNTIVLPFESGVADQLKKAIAGKKAVTIDLRNNLRGDFAEMQSCLAAVAPAGNYGTLRAGPGDRSKPFTVATGNPSPPKLNLLVDRSTRGAAEIFALALASKGIATLTGGGMDPQVFEIETKTLPDGAGYTLVTGEYKPPKPVSGALREVGK